MPEVIDILYNNTNCFHNTYNSTQVLDVFGPHLWRKQDVLASRIMDGAGKASYGEAPWAVSIHVTGRNEFGVINIDDPHKPQPGKQVAYENRCSGVLITKRWVLTVADCFRENMIVGKAYRTTKVMIGNYDLYPEDEVMCVSQHYQHGVGTVGVVLCLLERDVDIKNKSRHLVVNTVCMPETGRVPIHTELATMFGFGVIDWQNVTNHWLRKGDVKLQPSSACPDPYPEKLCSDYKRDFVSTPCWGDLGAGVVQYIDKYETRAILVATHANRGQFSLKNCGLKGFTPETIYILYNNTKCFHNSYSPQTVMDMNGPHLWRKQDLMTSRIMGGRVGKAKLGEAPWVVSIVSTSYEIKWRFKYFKIECSGVLVTNRWVLTAAECLIHQGNMFQKTFIRSGNNKEELLGIVNEVSHNQYGSGRTDGVALCRLEPYVNIEVERQLMSINTICLPVSDRVLTRTELATIYGFGVHDPQNGADNWLRKGVIKLQPSSACPDPYPEKLCSDYKRDNISTPCYGDLGAGVVQYTDKYETRAILVATHANRGQFADKACHPQHELFIESHSGDKVHNLWKWNSTIRTDTSSASEPLDLFDTAILPKHRRVDVCKNYGHLFNVTQLKACDLYGWAHPLNTQTLDPTRAYVVKYRSLENTFTAPDCNQTDDKCIVTSIHSKPYDHLRDFCLNFIDSTFAPKYSHEKRSLVSISIDNESYRNATNVAVFKREMTGKSIPNPYYMTYADDRGVDTKHLDLDTDESVHLLVDFGDDYPLFGCPQNCVLNSTLTNITIDENNITPAFHLEIFFRCVEKRVPFSPYELCANNYTFDRMLSLGWDLILRRDTRFWRSQYMRYTEKAYPYDTFGQNSFDDIYGFTYKSKDQFPCDKTNTGCLRAFVNTKFYHSVCLYGHNYKVPTGGHIFNIDNMTIGAFVYKWDGLVVSKNGDNEEHKRFCTDIAREINSLSTGSANQRFVAMTAYTEGSAANLHNNLIVAIDSGGQSDYNIYLFNWTYDRLPIAQSADGHGIPGTGDELNWSQMVSCPAKYMTYSVISSYTEGVCKVNREYDSRQSIFNIGKRLYHQTGRHFYYYDRDVHTFLYDRHVTQLLATYFDTRNRLTGFSLDINHIQSNNFNYYYVIIHGKSSDAYRELGQYIYGLFLYSNSYGHGIPIRVLMPLFNIPANLHHWFGPDLNSPNPNFYYQLVFAWYRTRDKTFHIYNMPTVSTKTLVAVLRNQIPWLRVFAPFMNVSADGKAYTYEFYDTRYLEFDKVVGIYLDFEENTGKKSPHLVANYRVDGKPYLYDYDMLNWDSHEVMNLTMIKTKIQYLPHYCRGSENPDHGFCGATEIVGAFNLQNHYFYHILNKNLEYEIWRVNETVIGLPFTAYPLNYKDLVDLCDIDVNGVKVNENKYQYMCPMAREVANDDNIDLLYVPTLTGRPILVTVLGRSYAYICPNDCKDVTFERLIRCDEKPKPFAPFDICGQKLEFNSVFSLGYDIYFKRNANFWRYNSLGFTNQSFQSKRFAGGGRVDNIDYRSDIPALLSSKHIANETTNEITNEITFSKKGLKPMPFVYTPYGLESYKESEQRYQYFCKQFAIFIEQKHETLGQKHDFQAITGYQSENELRNTVVVAITATDGNIDYQ
ncbi:unnamed protein product [Medioppia subpectinata]|uniref:Peptidase S1 domain-containing protein n=1 Tax=Medioppia subpectinata TaxID=1979941 RepID=A0A7R9KD17_9ACAR|nr:unnamed protein product [Medioppia subpectinata]CAG2101251.1 unnamed protein product [Medioppia subpectinata]